jgi:hypothetical protein
MSQQLGVGVLRVVCESNEYRQDAPVLHGVALVAQ